MGLTREELEEQAKSKREGIEKLHEGTRTAANPKSALEEMAQSDEYVGVAFTKDQVFNYIGDKLKQAEKENPRDLGDETPWNSAYDTISGMDEDKAGSTYVKESLASADGVREHVGEDGRTYFVKEEDTKSGGLFSGFVDYIT